MKDFEEGTEGSAASVRRVGMILAGVVLGAVAVFSLGVMVGQRVTESVPSLGEPPPSVPMETLVPPASPAPEKSAVGKSTSPSSGDKLTFFDTLSGEKASSPPTLPKTPPPKPASPPPKPPPATAAAPAAASPAERVNALRGSGSWYVQVSSTTSRQGANDFVARLKKKGVKAVSTPVTLKGKQWHRVRIGSFPDRNSANQAQKILKQKMKIDGLVMGG
jgi:cell division septation protein DedD